MDKTVPESVPDMLGQQVRPNDYVVRCGWQHYDLEVSKVKSVSPKGCTVFTGTQRRVKGGDRVPQTKWLKTSAFIKISPEDALAIKIKHDWKIK